MGLIYGLDNSVLFVFLALMSFVLYIFWNVLQKVMERRPVPEQNQQGESDPFARTGEHEECSICTDRIKYKVELDCRHTFCGKCIMDYYDSLRPAVLRCPLCRQNIRIVNAENLTRDDATRDFYDKIVIFNHRNMNGYTGYLADFSYLFNRGIASIFSDPVLVFYFLFALGIVIYYVLTPYDLIPDSLGLIGYIDDFSVVIGLAVWVIERFYAAFRNRVESDFHQIESQ